MLFTLPPATLPELLAQQAHTRGQATALRFEGQHTSYAALHQQMLHMTVWLATHSVCAGDRVAYLGLNHPGQLALLFALARRGAILVPLNYRLAAAEWDAVLTDCTPCCVVSDAHWQVQASNLAARASLAHTTLDDLLPDTLTHSAVLHAPASLAQPQHPVLLVYTSGTTGLPRGALHTQANLLANMAIASANSAQAATDLIASVLPLFHVGGLCIQTLPALYVGAQVILHARFDAGALLHCLHAERPTLTLQVPATMRALVSHPDWAQTDMSSLRAVWAGSSVLPANLVQAFHARGVPVCNVYGSTETGPFSIALPPAYARSHAGSCGWPASPAVEVKLANIQAGVGEICIRAPNVATRYWPGQPLQDAEGFFHTGDLACCAPDGSYTVVGRAKDMLISGGENIYPAELENLMAAHPGVADCAVVGLPDAQWGEVVVACVVCEPAKALSTAELQTQLHDMLACQIARYKLPRRWVWLPELPKTALGKVQKDKLRESLIAASQFIARA